MRKREKEESESDHTVPSHAVTCRCLCRGTPRADDALTEVDVYRTNQ